MGNSRGIASMGNYAYVTSYVPDQGSGLQGIDISSPEDPKQIESFGTSGFAYTLAFNERYAYVVDWGSGLKIIDISDPAYTREVGSYLITWFAREIAIRGDYAFVADGYEGIRVPSQTINPLMEKTGENN